MSYDQTPKLKGNVMVEDPKQEKFVVYQRIALTQRDLRMMCIGAIIFSAISAFIWSIVRSFPMASIILAIIFGCSCAVMIGYRYVQSLKKENVPPEDQ